MAIDLSQFRQVFIEESFEGLDNMEAALMELDINAIDSETINAIFRAAHSIKGGGATFGFSAIAGFTHVLETLLDQVRSGQRGLSASSVNLLLKSVDAMREMLGLLQSDQNLYTESALVLKAEFEALLNVPASGQSAEPTTATSKKTPKKMPKKTAPKKAKQPSGHAITAGWKIEFTPEPTLFSSGNCPVNIIRELSQLGVVIANPILTAIPDIKNILPEHCYLSWRISLASACSKDDILAVFSWVDDQADIRIEPVIDTQIAEFNNARDNYAGWKVCFKPNPDLLHTGNDPLRIFRALQELGYCEVNLVDSELPGFHLYDSQLMYLNWEINCFGEISHDAIMSVFDWVDGDCTLTITAIEPGGEELLDDDDEDEKHSISGNSAQTTINQTNNQKINQETPSNVVPFVPAVASPSTPQQTAEPAKKAANAEASSIRVGIDKIDSLINMVGELVITQSMLGQLGSELDVTLAPKLMEGLSQLAQNTRELQESVMRIRMLPISFAFSRFPRMVRDLGQTLGKKIHIELNGENTELDKTVMEKIGDPLVHLVRNAVDHGIESPEVRLANGKSEEGHIMLNAYHQSGNVIIEITDDGKGLDREAILRKAIEKNIITPVEANNLTDEQVYDLIFQPGFSTAQTVSDVSGRGVGMDVVKRNIQALNGVVEVSSAPNKGSKIRIRLPLTLAILDGQLVRVNDHIYIFPLVSIVESVQHRIECVRNIAGGCSVFKLREDYVPILHLKDIFNLGASVEREEPSLMVVVESEGEKVGIVVDELLAQQQVVIKSLEQNYKKVEGVSGATILGDGTVALILDIPGIVNLAGVRHAHQQIA
ncbi:MAG: hypothetical protein RL497_2391 [Pseudomonadota bacterium]|jgi:two-component system chemotaxis sensor kinase CheA